MIELLQEIEIDPIDICNRECSFCPRGIGYPNTKRKLTDEVSLAINRSLREIDYSNLISFCGMGEPLLHKQLEHHISIILQGVNPSEVLLETNGDYLTYNRVQSLVDAGITHLEISLYDSDTSSDFEKIVDQRVKVSFNHYYDSGPTQLVNRNEVWKNSSGSSQCRTCYYPFHFTLIDFDGNILLCANDWTKHHTFGNIVSTSICEAWSSDSLDKIRQELLFEGRLGHPCSTCSVDGQKYGREQVVQYYKMMVANGLQMC
jgi:MoaA/NifB/PqqE/SkfB family radical SAM enzyme